MNRYDFFSANFLQPLQAATLALRAEQWICLTGYLRTLVRNSTPCVASRPRTLHVLFPTIHATRLLVQLRAQTPRS